MKSSDTKQVPENSIWMEGSKAKKYRIFVFDVRIITSPSIPSGAGKHPLHAGRQPLQRHAHHRRLAGRRQIRRQVPARGVDEGKKAQFLRIQRSNFKLEF